MSSAASNTPTAISSHFTSLASLWDCPKRYPAPTINPSSNLASSTGYYVTLVSGVVTDFLGNPYAGIASTTALNFTMNASQSYAPGSGAPTM